MRHYFVKVTLITLAGVAQLVRASACHAEGRGFESLHSRNAQNNPVRDFFVCAATKVKGLERRRRSTIFRRRIVAESGSRVLRSFSEEGTCDRVPSLAQVEKNV